jgi:hypothetical protein
MKQMTFAKKPTVLIERSQFNDMLAALRLANQLCDHHEARKQEAGIEIDTQEALDRVQRFLPGFSL